MEDNEQGREVDMQMMLTLRVVIAGKDSPPFIITLPCTSRVSDLSNAIFNDPGARLSPRLHRLRFIAAGRNVSSGTPSLVDAGLTDGMFIHCVVSDILRYEDDPDSSPSENDPLMPCEDQESGLVTIDLGPPINSLESDIMDDGTLNDWIWGFVLGALLGLIMMILAMDRSIALSAKWKRGIGYGTAINVLFGVFLLATGRLH